MTLRESRAGWLVSVGQWLAWLAASAGAILDALYIREALLDVLVWYRVTSLEAFRKRGGTGPDLDTTYAVSTMDYAAIFILACLVVAAIVTIDYYFRKGRARGLLMRRILTVAGIEIGIVLTSILVQIII